MNTPFPQNMKELKVWIVSDKKPGHHNQSMGLIEALSSVREVKLSEMKIISKFELFQMLSFKVSEIRTDEKPDLIIGGGHKTHLSLLAYRRCFGGKVIVMMRPSLPLRFFDLCFIPRHDKPRKALNIVETVGVVNRVVPSKSQLPNDGLFLLGGPSKHYEWDVNKVIQQMESLIFNNNNIKWEIASSRRTPIESIDAINARFPNINIIQPEAVSKDWLPQKMQKSGTIWVTEDSVSMIYEALTSGAKTGVIRLNMGKVTRVTEEINRLVLEGRVVTLMAENMKEHQSLNEADRSAKLIIKKFDL